MIVETFRVTKQFRKESANNRFWFRYKTKGIDVNQEDLEEMGGFKLAYNKKLTAEDISHLEDKWKHKIDSSRRVL